MTKTNETVSIFVSGDVCPMWKINRMLVDGQVDKVFGDCLDDIHGCDLSVLSLEAPLTVSNKAILKCGALLKAPPSVAKSFAPAGYNIACLANNHILDYDAKGLLDTTKALKDNGLKSFGVGRDQTEATKPLFVTKNSIRFAFIGVSETEFTCAEDGWGAGRIDPVQNCDLISKASKKADKVILFVHGGNEFCPFPSLRMIDLYRAYVRAGASAVIGSHAHVPQGYEVYQGSPIFYSLGNFIFPWFEQPVPALLWERGYAVKLHFSKKILLGFDIVPTVMNSETGTIKRMTKDEKAQFDPYLTQLSTIIDDSKKLKKLWNAWCVMQGPEHWLVYMKQAIWPAKTQAQRKSLAILENMVRCEAHHEVGSTLLRLSRTRQLGEARKYIPTVKALMKAYL